MNFKTEENKMNSTNFVKTINTSTLHAKHKSQIHNDKKTIHKQTLIQNVNNTNQCGQLLKEIIVKRPASSTHSISYIYTKSQPVCKTCLWASKLISATTTISKLFSTEAIKQEWFNQNALFTNTKILIVSVMKFLQRLERGELYFFRECTASSE